MNNLIANPIHLTCNTFLVNYDIDFMVWRWNNYIKYPNYTYTQLFEMFLQESNIKDDDVQFKSLIG